jgi:hypothetical protein
MITPYLFHCPHGAPKREFSSVVSYFLAHCQMPTEPTVDVVTYNNTKTKFPLEFQAEKLGLRLHVVARDFRPWSWVAKITEPKKLLETLPPDEIVMLVDGNDTIFTRAPHRREVLEIMEFYKSPGILFCPTSVSWPPDGRCGRFERSLSSSPKPFLSAGGYVGKVKAILRGLNWIEARRPKGRFLFRGCFNDQLAWRKAHQRFYPRIVVDSACYFFNRFDTSFLRLFVKNGGRRPLELKAEGIEYMRQTPGKEGPAAAVNTPGRLSI